MLEQVLGLGWGLSEGGRTVSRTRFKAPGNILLDIGGFSSASIACFVVALSVIMIDVPNFLHREAPTGVLLTKPLHQGNSVRHTSRGVFKRAPFSP